MQQEGHQFSTAALQDLMITQFCCMPVMQVLIFGKISQAAAMARCAYRDEATFQQQTGISNSRLIHARQHHDTKVAALLYTCALCCDLSKGWQDMTRASDVSTSCHVLIGHPVWPTLAACVVLLIMMGQKHVGHQSTSFAHCSLWYCTSVCGHSLHYHYARVQTGQLCLPAYVNQLRQIQLA